jgi:hypothetical protein
MVKDLKHTEDKLLNGNLEKGDYVLLKLVGKKECSLLCCKYIERAGRTKI